MTYKIGTRVKKIGNHPPTLGITPVPIGAEGVVIMHQCLPKGTLTQWGGANHDLDCVVEFNGYGKRSMHTSKLQPIVPEGHRPGIKDTCEPLDKLLSEVRHEVV